MQRAPGTEIDVIQQLSTRPATSTQKVIFICDRNHRVPERAAVVAVHARPDGSAIKVGYSAILVVAAEDDGAGGA